MSQSVDADYVIGYGGGHGFKTQDRPSQPILPPQPKPTPQEGAAHWAKLHTAESPNAEWLTNWIARIPAYGCSCHSDFHKILAANPPRFDDWFPWTVEVHNTVNEKVENPVITLEQASAIWGRKQFEWRKVDGPRVGFLASGLSVIGGTETFHLTLIPRLANAIGFATPGRMLGDWKALGVPAHHGRDAMRALCAESDVIVSWLVNPRDYGFKGRVIMVHHGPPIDREQNDASLVGDEIVCVSKETAEHLRTLTNGPVHWIPNAVDPARLVARNAIDLPAKKLCVWIHRFSQDKRPELACVIGQHLPPDWHMVLAGYGGGDKLPENDHVTILPAQHPGDLLSVASCFLSTSLFDGFGLSVAEAIAAKVPVVSSPAGIATEPGLATIVPHDAHPSVWAEAIVAAAENPARPELPMEYSLETHVKRWNALLSVSGETTTH